MLTRITLVLLLLVILCPLGCFSLSGERNRRQRDALQKDAKSFRDDFYYYIFNIDRPDDKPQRTDRSILRQAMRDLRAARDDWDYFIRDMEPEGPRLP